MKPPKGLRVKVLQEGIGLAADYGDVVDLSSEVRFISGAIFWEKKRGTGYQLGSREYMVGLEHGAIGMRVGEIREVKVPPNLTYYERKIDPGLSDRAVLVYRLELHAIIFGKRAEEH